MNKRKFIKTIGGILIGAPAIVQAQNIMSIKPRDIPEPFNTDELWGEIDSFSTDGFTLSIEPPEPVCRLHLIFF